MVLLVKLTWFAVVDDDNNSDSLVLLIKSIWFAVVDDDIDD